jgi:hypothetical protein
MLAAQDLQEATHEERQALVKEAVEAASEPEKPALAAAAIDALSPEQRKDVITEAVASAPETQKKDVAAAAVDALTPQQRKDLIATGMFPSESHDRLYVYVAGFSAAAVVVVGLALVAWGAQGGSNSISTALVVLATGFSSAILGGLLGAYVQR